MKHVPLLAFLVVAVPACSGGGGNGRGGGETPPAVSNHPPGIVLVSPTPGTTVLTGESVRVEAEASDTDGDVVQVDFFEGATLLGTVFTPPFRIDWTAAPARVFSLTAVATDDGGAVTTSTPVSITVHPPGTIGPANRPPSVLLTSPLNGASFTDRAAVTITAEAADPGGGVASVEFFDGSASLGLQSRPPFGLVWTATPPGTHSLRAVATDDLGASTSSNPVSVTVTGGGGSPPPPSSVTVRPEGNLRGVFFADATTGWIVGSQGRIYATTDGGVTWAAQSSGTTAQLNRVQFASRTTGWAVGAGGTILKTTDGGAAWTALSSGTSNVLTGLSFVTAATGWTVGGEGTLLKTTDGGARWTRQESGTAATLGAVSFASERKGWVDASGEILSTGDGGASWSRRTTEFMSFTGIPHLALFADARFVSETRGTFVGTHRGGDVIFTTTDGGATWTIVEMHANFAQWRGVAFGDGAHFWAVGSKGLFETDQAMIAASTDGGLTWVDQASPTAQPLNGVWFVSATTGWAVGDGGTVLRTTDGGARWVLLAGGT